MKKDKKARGKYGTKTPTMKILHKYTGLIIMGALALVGGIIFLYYQDQAVFFENWSCVNIQGMNEEGLTPEEITRFKEIQLECNLRPR